MAAVATDLPDRRSPAERVAETIATLPPAERRALARKVAKHRRKWRWWARTNQVEPPGNWQVWPYISGRGGGKTRAGAEWCIERSQRYKRAGIHHRGALVGRTAADVRDTMVEGESGLMECLDRHGISAKYEPGRRRVLIPPLDTEFHTYSAMEPDSLRGPQHHTLWGDEVAAWRQIVDAQGNTAWTNGLFGLRLDAPGLIPRAMATTTPKATPLVMEWFAAVTPCGLPAGHAGKCGPATPGAVRGDAPVCGRTDPTIAMTTGSLYDNIGHLAPAFVAAIVDRYRHSPLARQEILGLLVLAVEGALWSPDRIAAGRLLDMGLVPPLSRVIVAVDPPAGFAAEAGIVVLGIEAAPLDPTRPGVYVLDDMSMRGQAHEWGAQVIAAVRHYGADLVVAENNQGGDMVRATIQLQDPTVPFEPIHAKSDKWSRAEPVASVYGHGQVHHVGYFPDLEGQMTTWTVDDPVSPDRMDALVHGVRYLLPELTAPPAESKSAADLRIGSMLGARR